MSTSNTLGNFPSPDTVLFNDMKQPTDIKIAPGKRYLIRIVNVGSVACNQFHIEGYTLNVVETDGVQVQSTPADTILFGLTFVVTPATVSLVFDDSNDVSRTAGGHFANLEIGAL